MNATNVEWKPRVTRGLVATLAVMLAVFAPTSCAEQQQEVEQVEQADSLQVEELQTRITELEDRLAEEQAALEQLRQEKTSLEEQLPQPHRVTEGQSHWQISFDFLTEEKGMAADEAERTLGGAFLLDPIVEGHQTWSFYDGETFGTFVTQDDAPVSPGDLMREKEASRERMQDRIASLHQELAIKETRLTEAERLRSDLDAKTNEIASLRSHIDSLEQHQERLATRLANVQQRLSSVYYLAGSEAQLRDDGKIRRTFLNIGRVRLGALQSEDFQGQLDLREASQIELQAERFNLSRIDDVTLLPGSWQEGRDYEVEIAGDGQSATVQLLNPEKFRLKSLVLVVDS